MTTLLQAPQIMSTIAYIYHDMLTYQNIMAMAEVLKGTGFLSAVGQLLRRDKYFIHFSTGKPSSSCSSRQLGLRLKPRFGQKIGNAVNINMLCFGFHFDKNIYTNICIKLLLFKRMSIAFLKDKFSIMHQVVMTYCHITITHYIIHNVLHITSKVNVSAELVLSPPPPVQQQAGTTQEISMLDRLHQSQPSVAPADQSASRVRSCSQPQARDSQSRICC